MSGPRSGLVAVLFSDLVGSTELMSQLGDRAFDELRRQHFAALSRAVAAHGGEEVKNTGDGLMAVFPAAAEAVEAAVAMQQATARQAKNGPLSIRIGVAVGDATFEDRDYFGTPVVEAARLVAAARPGQILTTSVVRMVAGSRSTARFADLGLLQLKGLSEPVAVCEVAWEPLPGSSVPMPALLTDVGHIFVGRDTELERLDHLWKEASAGERRFAMLAGEPGVGKTRLAAELATHCQEEGAIVLAGRCDEDLGLPFQPFVEALRHFVDHTPPEQLGTQLGRYGGELARLVPDLSGMVPELPAPLQSDPETERYRLFEAVAGWLAGASADQPVLLVLDDLQWAAKPTLFLLRHLVRSADAMRVLVVGIYRDTDLVDQHPLLDVLADLRRTGDVERVSLSGLDPLGVAAFMEEAAGRDLDDEDLALARAVHHETEGNLFFVREVFRHLAETGAIERREGRWVTRLPMEELGIPEGVSEVVARRLSRLSVETNQLLRVAAVAGAEFELPVIQRVADLDDEQLITTLEEASTARLVIESGHRFRFAHALVRDTLYGQLSTIRRAVLHQRVAEALEATWGTGPGPRVADIARQWLAARSPRAIEYALWAGQAALDALAAEEATQWFSQGLQLGRQEPRFEPASEVQLLLGLGQAQLLAGEPEHRDTLLEAAHLARATGDRQRLVEAALANSRGTHSRTGGVDHQKVEVLEAALAQMTGMSAERALLSATLAVELLFAGDWPRRRALADEAIVMARELVDPTTLVRVANLVYLAICVPETLNERLTTTSEVVALAESLSDPAAYHFACRFRTYACAEAADLEGFNKYLDETTRSAELAGEPSLRWVAGFVRAGRALLGGRVGDAETLAAEAFQLGTESGQPDARPIFAGGLLEIRRHQNRLAEMEEGLAATVADNPGLHVLRAKLAELYCEVDKPQEARNLLAGDLGNHFANFGYDLTWLHSMTAYAEVSARLGEEKAAQVLYERLSPWHDQVAFIYYATNGAVAHYLGMLATLSGRFDSAEVHFGEAMKIHRRLQAPFWIARTHLEGASMLLARRRPGDEGQARLLLDRALRTAQQFQIPYLERRAAAILERQS